MAILVLISVLALVLTPLIARAMAAVGLVDRPDSPRKIHSGPIPRGGGLAVAIAYITTLWLSGAEFGGVWNLLPAAGVVFLVGVADDLCDLHPWQKLAGQIVAAAMACSSGLLGGAISWWTVPLAMLWLLACCNGFNLIDGMDGLAAGAGVLASLAIAIGAILSGNTMLAAAALPLAGALAGFLVFNFSPARIFLGDSGSLLIGFLLGCFGILGLEKHATPAGLSVPVIALALPLGDASLTVVRRAMGRRPIFVTDRGHIHHRLLDRVRSSRKATPLIYIFCGFAGALSIAASFAQSTAVSLLLAGLLCTGGVAAWSLGVMRRIRRETALQRSTSRVRLAGSGMATLISDDVRWRAAARRVTVRNPRSVRRGDWLDITGIPE
ncbi:MAG TPA: MraY family glycosyltransferase [Bryobacteraceae bacterium]